MASNFSFGFSGDDIDRLDDDTGSQEVSVDQTVTAEDQEPSDPFYVAPKRHTLQELLVPYRTPQTFHITSTSIDVENASATVLRIPHRAAFDIRMSLMAASTPPASPILSGIDLVPGTYEGGWQVWEGAIDLVKVLFHYTLLPAGAEEGDDIHVIELGAGIALPSLFLFQRLLRLDPESHRGIAKFTVSDYNHEVLRLATIPAFLLTWMFSSSTSPMARHDGLLPEDIEITPALVRLFEQDLLHRKIEIDAISGSWGAEFTNLISNELVRSQQECNLLVLASETIYAPKVMETFTNTFMSLLRGNKLKTSTKVECGYIAAKKHYFGVGGSVDDLLRLIADEGGEAIDVFSELNSEEGAQKEGIGVQRAVLRVRLA